MRLAADLNILATFIDAIKEIANGRLASLFSRSKYSLVELRELDP